MTLEVELKYRVADTADLKQKLSELGTRSIGVEWQSDDYFNHPCRDFGDTDEAFRIRVQSDKAYLTYKGPRIDSETKTRREIEVPLESAEAPVQLAEEMIGCLGFRSVATVKKSRQTFQVPWQNQEVTLTHDEVEGLGSFVEIELVVDDSQLSQAKACLLGLASHLNLSQPIHESYLELLLQNEQREVKK